ncbi:MAG TPA: hypothetical protein VFA94_12450 [Acidimicrobiales bacterium]|nr:hypothetical protein [Acidimicrobiales bacterium]
MERPIDIGGFVKQLRERIEAEREVRGDDVNAVFAVNVGQSDEATAASAYQDVEIIQNGRRTHLRRRS